MHTNDPISSASSSALRPWDASANELPPLNTALLDPLGSLTISVSASAPGSVEEGAGTEAAGRMPEVIGWLEPWEEEAARAAAIRDEIQQATCATSNLCIEPRPSFSQNGQFDTAAELLQICCSTTVALAAGNAEITLLRGITDELDEFRRRHKVSSDACFDMVEELIATLRAMIKGDRI